MIDLSTLEQGDIAILRNGREKRCVHAFQAESSIVAYFIDDDKDTPYYTIFNKDGTVAAPYYGSENFDIVEIIKNPKRWDDRDMRQAYLAGIDAVDFDGDVFDSFGDWLEQYKQVKKDETV